jgi:hypothetical protein
MNKKKSSADLLGSLIESSKAKPAESQTFDGVAALIQQASPPHSPVSPPTLASVVEQPAESLLKGLKARPVGSSGSVKLDAELYAWVRAYALEHGLYPSQVINALIAEFRQRVVKGSPS